MVNLRLKLKNKSDIRRISIEESDYNFEQIFNTIVSLYKNDKIITLAYETNSLNNSLCSQKEWDSAVKYAIEHNNCLTILAISEESLLEDSLLQEQDDFVILGDSLIKEQPEINIEDEIINDDKKQDDDNSIPCNISGKDFFTQLFKGKFFQQVVETVEDTFDNVVPVIEDFIDNNQSQIEQIACTVKDTVDDVINNASKNINEILVEEISDDDDNDEQVINSSKDVEIYDAAVFDSEFIEDISVPDKTEFAPNTSFIKSWKIKNSGNMNWPEKTTIQFVGGDNFTVNNSVFVGSKSPEEEVIISIPMKSPKKPGTYRAYFRMCCPFNGNIPFGSRIWCEIVVPEEEEEEFKYSNELAILKEMGFNEEICKVILNENNGNLEEATNELLNN